MTALAGMISFSGRPRLADGCAQMLQAQRIYGSGAPSQWSSARAALGRDLFRTLPEDVFDTGLTVAGGGRFVLAADVRLDNREELGRKLGLPEPDIARLPDAAILVEALTRWGEDAVPLLIGDFAFALWDEEKRQLLLARDFLGQRPLHFHRGRDMFAFASMPKGLHALPEVPRRPDSEAVAGFLALLPEQGSGSYFEGIERVMPGHLCRVTAEGVRQSRYWDPAPRPLRLRTPADYDEAVREQFDRAVAARLRGAAPKVGTHLSGGLDSSAVAATAARLMAGGGVVAFTSVPRDGYSGPVPRGRFADEGPHAAAVAALYPNMEHMLVRTAGKSPLASLDRNFFLFERPVLNLCNSVWTHGIMDAAKAKRLPVMLTGQMGNMSFSYTGLEALPGLLARGRILRLISHAVRLRRGGVRLESFASHTFGPFMPAWAWRAINRARGRHFNLNDYSSVHPDRAASLAAEAKQRGLDFSYRPRSDPFGMRLWALRRVDGGNYNKGYLGGWGIDLRDPTADRRLMELCLSIPAEVFMSGGRTRAVARSAFADRLPEQVLGETRKGLQAIDWHEGLSSARDEVGAELERLTHVEEARGALDTDMLGKLVAEWPEGQWNSQQTSAKYRLALLRGLSGGHFLRKATGSNR